MPKYDVILTRKFKGGSTTPHRESGINAESDSSAITIAKDRAQSKHPEDTFTVKEVKKISN
jgi:hypothetical protein